MNAAATRSRRKIWSNVRMTEVVPAPDEPNTAMMGCVADMAAPPRLRGTPQDVARAEQGRFIFETVVLAVVALDALDFRARAEDEADALLQALGFERQNGLAARARASPRLFDQKADGVRCVKQAQPTGLREVPAIARIHEDTAAHENAMRLRHERGDPAHVEVAPARTRGARLTLTHIAADRSFPVARVRRVDRELGGALRDAQIRMRQHELADLAIEREAVHAAADRQDEHRGRTIDRVARADLVNARLQEVIDDRLAHSFGTPQYR